ncbi:MAG TPA: type II toxin-antitoxin system PrlF family antitoxin [Chloroflexia bacterium]
MKRLLARVSNRGQVTIPAEMRRHLGIKQGDKITFVLDDEGTVTVEVTRYSTIASLRGAAGSLPKPMNWSDIEAVVREERAATDCKR